jgi:putative transcriptional regulator
MIEIRLKELSERLGKNISDIARETGLNRNTVTDLFHNRVDGIKFSTIDTLCETYGCNLTDLVGRKEFRIGAAPTSKIVREIHPSTSPFFSWLFLRSLQTPSPRYFDHGVGSVYAFFIREGAEFYLDQREANRCARSIYERYQSNNLIDVHEAFLRARDQLLGWLNGLSHQPLNQYVVPELIKALQRLNDLCADVLCVSAWIESFQFGVREEIITQLQKTHQFSAKEVSLLATSSEPTSLTALRLELLQIASEALQAHVAIDDMGMFLSKNPKTKRFLSEYPHVSHETCLRSIQTYLSHPSFLALEQETLGRLQRTHGEAVKAILRTHHLRLNPLQFFASLESWREERDEVLTRSRFYMERILEIIAKRSSIPVNLASYLLPQELPHIPTGFISEHLLRRRFEAGFLVAIEGQGYKVHEGEQAVSIQDDLASRYLSQLAYDNVS